MKKVLLLLVLIFVLFGSSACNKDEDGEKVFADTVIVAYADDLDTPNPYGSTSSSCHFYTNSTHSVLIKNDYVTGQLVGVLAQTWDDVNGNGTEWRIHLRENVKFHDGTTLNADDVVFTWNWAKDVTHEGVVKPINSADKQVKEIIAEDANTVLFKLNYAIPDFPSYLEIKILSEEAFETMAVADAAAIGTGPYRKGEIKSGISYGLTRFDDYYEGIEDFPSKNIVVKYIPDGNTAAASLQAGEIDYCFVIPTTSYSTLAADENIEIYNAPGVMSYYIGFNHKRDTWKNVEARQAIAMAVNKTDIVNITFENGIGASVNNNFCVPTGAGYTQVTPIAYNPTGAAELVEENGLTGSTVTIMATTFYKTWAETVQANLNAVGFVAEIDFVDSKNWTALKSSYEYDIYTGDYCSYTGALLHNFNRFFTIGGSSNVYGFESPEWEAMMVEIQTCETYSEMVTQFAVMQQWAADNVPVIPIAVNKAIGYANKDVGGVKLAPSYNLQELHYLYKMVPAGR
ncbi:MAG: ABC transporter substrate-binding protein [Lutibacter sp.]